MTKRILASSAGYCAGVERSIRMAEQALEHGPCYCLGELIHNRDAVELLSAKGLISISRPEELPAGAPVLIRSHGIPVGDRKTLEEKQARIHDATCPGVASIHSIVRRASENGSFIVVAGNAAHPEIRGICGYCAEYAVVKNREECEKLFLERPELAQREVTVVFQTTETEENHIQIVNLIKKVCTNAKIFDTICGATAKRQAEALRLSRLCDAMVVIGSPNSANSCHLADLCRENCDTVLFGERAADFHFRDLSACGIIGITAGASVPPWIIKEVVNKMSDEIKVEEITAEEVAATAAEEAAPQVPAEEAEKSFDQLLEESLHPISNGDTVRGVVMGITTTEVSVDLGTKHSGYIPVTEFTDNGTKIEDAIHVGDEIEACVVRVNDVEGTVMLSKKRLDNIRSWKDIEESQENGTVLEGKVTEENKGGVVVTVNGQRVFVPASQTDLPREAAMSELLGKTVRLKITEVDHRRKRVVGSIRDVARKERREKANQIWAEIEEGNKYTGTVKSMTSYGAFVDIGGVDGMVHVSEISWERISKPSDALNIGDTVEVRVLKVDKENHKISLGIRDPEQNPWTIFTGKYAVGDVAAVKVVKLMAFGAFAEVVPGVDGLIHISQIANRRIAQPSEVLTVGDVVDAKITGIDFDKKKISLSIRALSEPAPAAPKAEEMDEEEESGDDTLVYEVSAEGVASGSAPQEDSAEE